MCRIISGKRGTQKLSRFLISSYQEVRKMFVSDILTEDVTEWQEDSQVFISAPTGSGKTYFILHKLLPLALMYKREILYFSNRQILHKQLISEACGIFDIDYELMSEEKTAEFPGITFTTYQNWQEKLLDNELMNPNPFYYYVVLDEAHFFVSDGYFNPESYRLFNWLPKMKKSVTLAISATIEEVLPYFNFYNVEWTKVAQDDVRTIYSRRPHRIINQLKGRAEFMYSYEMKQEKPQYRIYIYDTIDEIVECVNADETGEKWLIFQSNKDTAAKELQRKLQKDSCFISADNKDGDVMNQIICDNSFNSSVLITTKVLDNGVSLHDRNIRKIVLDTVEQTEFLQMLGRRRTCEEDEQIQLYLPRHTKQYFAWLLNRNIRPALELMEKSEDVILQELMKNPDVYDIARRYFYLQNGKLNKNYLAERQLREQEKEYQKMMECLEEDENAFVKEQLKWLECDEQNIQIIELSKVKKQAEMEKLQMFLKRCQGIEIKKVEQKIFREKMQKFMKNIIDKWNARLPGLKRLNEGFSMLGIDMEIVAIGGKQKGEETVWVLQEK